MMHIFSPTPWNDLYKTYNWPEVQTVLEVQRATIIDINSKPEIIATKLFKNNSNKSATFDCSISEKVNNTTESNWSETDGIEVGQKFTYELGFLGDGGGGETSLKYTHEWGKGESESSAVTIGSTSGVEVDLEPGESIDAVLTASRGVMKVKIFYIARLIGSIAVNYDPTYKGHHFDHVDINDVIKAYNVAIPIGDPCGYAWESDRTEHVVYRSVDGHIHALWFQNEQWRHKDLTPATIIPTSIQFTEDIEIGYYSNSQIELMSPSGQIKKMVPSAVRAAPI